MIKKKLLATVSVLAIAGSLMGCASNTVDEEKPPVKETAVQDYPFEDSNFEDSSLESVSEVFGGINFSAFRNVGWEKVQNISKVYLLLSEERISESDRDAFLKNLDEDGWQETRYQMSPDEGNFSVQYFRGIDSVTITDMKDKTLLTFTKDSPILQQMEEDEKRSTEDSE